MDNNISIPNFIAYSEDIISHHHLNRDIIYSPKLYQPRNIIDILRNDVYSEKYRLYTTAEIYWPRLIHNMNYIKNSISSKKFKLNIFEQRNRDARLKFDLVESAQENWSGKVDENINSWKQMIEDIITSYGFGISIQEIMFEDVNGDILPYGSRFISANNFEMYGINNLYKIQLKNEGGYFDIPLNKFIVCLYKNRSTNNTTTYGMYSSIMWPFIARMYAQDYLLRFGELFGIPHRNITYPKDSSKELIQTLKEVSKNFGYGGWSAMPEGSKLDIYFGGLNTSGNAPQAIIDWADKECDITLVGNNLSSEVSNVGSKAATETHTDKENSVILNITDFVLDVLNNQVIKNICLVNGMTPDYLPYYTIDKPKDIQILSNKLNIISQLKSMGYNVDNDELIEEIGTYGINVSIPEEIPESEVETEVETEVESEASGSMENNVSGSV